MRRKKSKAVPEGNGLFPMQGGTTLEELQQVIMSETMGESFKEIKEDLRRVDQPLASLEHDARQPRLAIEADVKADEKTCERTEDAATAVQTMHGDSFRRVQAGPTTSNSFGVKAEPPAFPCRNDVLVENDAAAPK